MISDRALITTWTAMQRAALATCPGFCDGPAAEAKLRRALTDALCRARLDGHFAVSQTGGAIDALFAASLDPGSWYGAEVCVVTIGVDPTSPTAPAWIVEQLRALDRRWRPLIDLKLFAAWHPVIDAVLTADLGLGVDSAILLGDPRRALAALIDRHDPPAELTPFGLTAGPLRDEAEVDAIIDLKRRLFSRHPAFCWFGALPRALARDRAALLTRLDTGAPDDLGELLFRDGVLVGAIGLPTDAADPIWGHVTGVELLLDPSLWGRGLVKTLYRRGLTRLVERGVNVFKGGTSQPAVLGLGRLMARPLMAVNLRPAAPFDRAHFQGYI